MSLHGFTMGLWRLVTALLWLDYMITGSTQAGAALLVLLGLSLSLSGILLLATLTLTAKVWREESRLAAHPQTAKPARQKSPRDLLGFSGTVHMALLVTASAQMGHQFWALGYLALFIGLKAYARYLEMWSAQIHAWAKQEVAASDR